MIDQDVLKNIIHHDEAFTEILKKDPEGVLKTLNEMHMTVSTQLAKYGQERIGWYRSAKSLAAVLKARMGETNQHIQKINNNWKTVTVNFLQKMYEHGYGNETEPEWDTLKEVEQWLNTVNL